MCKKKSLWAFHRFFKRIQHSTTYQTHKRLQKVLNEDEIQFQKAIYSRLKIKLRSKSFKPNIGVAQGSVISPAMFNIYSEDLLYKIEEEAFISAEDLLASADDLLVLCSSPHQLRKVIKIIQKWSNENNLGLNAKKSGIVEFLPRCGNQKSFLKLGSQFEGIPIVSEYKYLGLFKCYTIIY